MEWGSRGKKSADKEKEINGKEDREAGVVKKKLRLRESIKRQSKAGIILKRDKKEGWKQGSRLGLALCGWSGGGGTVAVTHKDL